MYACSEMRYCITPVMTHSAHGHNLESQGFGWRGRPTGTLASSIKGGATGHGAPLLVGAASLANLFQYYGCEQSDLDICENIIA